MAVDKLEKTDPWMLITPEQWYKWFQGLVNVQIQPHPAIGDIISNKYMKVMSEIPNYSNYDQPPLAF